MSAANELLSAIHARLIGDTELSVVIGLDGIRDRYMTGGNLPCIVIGDLATNDYSTSTEAGEEHLLTLEVWSEASGRKQAQQIAASIRALLANASLPLETHLLVNLQHVATLTRREAKARLFVAALRFRAVTESML
ncbi:hypothetical protein ASC97_03350 [Rhizobium sp. Root1203]|uniref:DUF3168 domain-containing protein n=1 Tax=Rhizobium sp. Root1203 TaxID=1736427 RepID=UPI00070BEB44|nr:DUF3168 domain-containing protein [Rhizobium sp. Root1203]KQV32616.1 hypothetical protein ASC97_03350 [Rhizobium sp. Root1203]